MAEQYRKYLPWLLLLVLARFFWMPAIDSRNVAKLEMNSTLTQIDRTQDIIDNRSVYLERKEQLQVRLAELSSEFVEFSEPSAFRLEFQRYLESLLSNSEVSIESINWFEPIIEGRLTWFSLEVSLSGAVDDIATFHRSLNTTKGVSINTVNWRTSNNRGRDWQWNVRSQYRLDIPVLAGEGQ
ncbi:hypothetical protein [Aliagarivorans taiwanensis]|uniref:hypothetical protein n=1 Tax=Aliagarivorans taiwanensis TaxID=561966 RepID=UPI00047DD46B|nr:hypothetical protein [Aliagarivorans taiwanensis]